MSQLKEVASHLAFDVVALKSYLSRALRLNSEITVLQYEGGQSNPTYLIQTHDAKFVLRRKPPGVLLPSAHAVDREYRIMSALKHTNVPVPEMVALCEDAKVIGTPFYLMKHVEGRIFETITDENVNPEERSALLFEMIRVLANLHQVDFKAIGLGDFGKTDDYVARQVSRWSKQYVASATTQIEAMDKLIEYLPLHLPKAGPAGIVHGDYRLGNIIFHKDRPEIVAVLDWEISTLGDPVSDLAYFCMPYHMAEPNGFKNRDFAQLGIPSQDSLFKHYFDLMKRPPLSQKEWTFYVAFSIFRMTSIIQGVYARALQGNASSEKALIYGPLVSEYANLAWDLLKK